MSSIPSADNKITVEVIYALPHAQYLSSIQVNRDCTAMEAVKKSGLPEQFPELASTALQLGVFGKTITQGATLEDGMRIEIYRPLILDPKESRRKRALLARK